MTASKPNAQSIRYYDLDWLRVLVILFVFFYHVGLVFWDGWYISASWTHEHIGNFLLFTSFLRMPVLFFIAGAGTWFVFRRRNVCQFLTERTKRLLVPFVAALVILVPIQNYAAYRFQAREGSDSAVTFVETLTRLFPAIHEEWGHLWFLAYLAIFSLLAAPLFRFLRSPKGSIWLASFLRILSWRAGVLLFAIPIVLIELSQRWRWPGSEPNLINDWAQEILFFVLFLYGFVLVASPRFWSAIQQTFTISLSITVIIGLALPLALLRVDRVPEHLTDVTYFLMHVGMGILGWTSLLVVLNLARRFLSFETRILRYARDASYPFYLLHHPIVIIVAFGVVMTSLHPLLQILLITVTSFVLTVGVYDLVVRRTNLTRYAFGLKPVAIRQETKPASQESVPQSVGG